MFVVREQVRKVASAESKEMEAPIRVLVIFGNIPLLGQERGNIQVFNCLKKVGVDSLFVTRERFGELVIQPALDQLGLKWRTAEYTGRISRGMSTKAWKKRIIESGRSIVNFIDIIRRYKPTHIHVSNDRMIVPLIPLFWYFRIPIVYRLGDVPGTSRWIFRVLWRYLIIPRVTSFVCISQFLKDKLLKLGVSEEKITVIYNSPPVRPMISMKSDKRHESFDGYTLLYIGQIIKDKGVDLLIESMISICKKRDDVRLLIAGDYSWNNSFASELIESVKKAGLFKRIEFLGYVEAIQQLLDKSDVHISPSICEEGLGNVVVEAKQAGIPSIVFPSGGLPELISHEVNGYVCAADTVDALINGIEYFLNLDRKEIQNMGRCARESMERLGIVEKHFSLAWQNVYRNATT